MIYDLPYDDPDIPIWFPDHVNISDNLSPLNISFGMVTTIWTRAPLLEILWKSLLVFLICSVGLLGNCLVVFLVLKQPKIRQQPVNIYIVNLAIADLLTIIFTPSIALVNNIYQNYELGPVMCKLEILIKMMCILTSIFSVMAISCQRFLNIKHPTSVQTTKSSHPRTLLVIIIIWILSIALALPLAFWRTYQERQWKDYLEKWCTDYPSSYSIRYWIFLISPLIYIPLIVMVVMYWLMILKINRFISKLQQSSGLMTSRDAATITSHSAYAGAAGGGPGSGSGAATNSSLAEVHELRVLQERHRQRMVARRRQQTRALTEPTDSFNHTYLSYFGEEGEDPRRSRSNSSISFATISTVSSVPYHLTVARSTYLEQQQHKASENLSMIVLPSSVDDKSPSYTMAPPHQHNRASLVTIEDGVKYSAVDEQHKNGVTHLHQQLANRQAMNATIHKRSIMFTIMVFCLITFFFWLPLQVLVYYRALKPKEASMACWYEKTKFVAQLLCAVNSAINPFVTFRRTFSQIYQQFRAKQKQRQLRERLKRNHLKLNNAPPPMHRRPKPSLESANMIPVIQIIEVLQGQSADRKRRRRRRMQVQLDIEEVPSGRTSSLKAPNSLEEPKEDEASSVKSNGHINGSIAPINSSDSTANFDPVAAYMAEATNSELELDTPSPDVAPVPIQLFTTSLKTDSTKDPSPKMGQEGEEGEAEAVSNEQVKATSSQALYTHNLTKKMLMKYIPERFVAE